MVAAYFAEVEHLIAEEALAHVLVAHHHHEGDFVGGILPQQLLPLLVDEGPGGVMVETDQFDDLALPVLDEGGELDVFVDAEVGLRGEGRTCSGLLCLEMGLEDF